MHSHSNTASRTVPIKFIQAGIFGSVLVLFIGVFLTSWALSQNVQALAVQAKTSAYNDMMRQKQGEACSVSYSFSWGLFGHSTRADSQYCAQLAEQVEAPSSRVHLRQLYCNKCPSTCSGYMERCSKDICYAPPPAAVPKHAQLWPAMCAHFTAGTRCTTTCQPGYKPGMAGALPTTTCMAGGVPSTNPHTGFWSAPTGSCVRDLQLKDILKPLKQYYVLEFLACMVWSYCLWYLNAHGPSGIARTIVIKYPIEDSAVVVPDTWAAQCLMQLLTVLTAVVYMASSMHLASVLSTAALAVATAAVLPMHHSRCCEVAYVLHAYIACYLVHVLQPVAAGVSKLMVYLEPITLPVRCAMGPAMVWFVDRAMWLAQLVISMFIPLVELMVTPVSGETTIMYERLTDHGVPLSAKVAPSISAYTTANGGTAATSLPMDMTGCSELQDPEVQETCLISVHASGSGSLDTITEEEEDTASHDAVKEDETHDIPEGKTEELAASEESEKAVIFDPVLMTAGSDVGVVVQVASRQKADGAGTLKG